MNLSPRLGPCCQCGTMENVCVIMMLDRRCVVPGHGWGCALCGLPPDGASSVLCEGCAADPELTEPRFVCRGYPATEGRVPAEGFRYEAFRHDEAAHNADTRYLRSIGISRPVPRWREAIGCIRRTKPDCRGASVFALE